MVRILSEATKYVSTACLLLALLWPSLSARAWPQTQLASVFGTITDASGAVVSDAHLTFVNKSTGLKRDVSTDLNGQYRVTGLPTGYTKGSLFGQPQSSGNYLAPRTFQMAFGVRF